MVATADAATIADGARALYNVALARQRLVLQKELHTHQRVAVADMEWDESTGALSCACRCGGVFALSPEDVEHGVTIVACTSCSMKACVDF